MVIYFKYLFLNIFIISFLFIFRVSLAQLSMVSLMILNRRRPGDIQRIEVADYQKINNVDKSSDAYKVSEHNHLFLESFLIF